MGFLLFLTPSKPPNTACTGRLVGCAFFRAVSELWRFPVSRVGSRQPPVTHTVGLHTRITQDIQ
jgi:hypothetical protein